LKDEVLKKALVENKEDSKIIFKSIYSEIAKQPVGNAGSNIKPPVGSQPIVVQQ
jgi:hypothetical protein